MCFLHFYQEQGWKCVGMFNRPSNLVKRGGEPSGGFSAYHGGGARGQFAKIFSKHCIGGTARRGCRPPRRPQNPPLDKRLLGSCGLQTCVKMGMFNSYFSVGEAPYVRRKIAVIHQFWDSTVNGLTALNNGLLLCL